MSEWKEYWFSDAIEICPTVSLKGTYSYSFVEMKDLNDGNRYCYPSIQRNLSSGSRFQDRDTLFARITPCLENGKISQVTGLKNGVGFGSTEFLVFRGKKEITDNDFVFYLSRSEEVRSFAEQNFDGTSGRQRVPKSTFDNLTILIPPLPEQRAIAGVLSSLDDKIDLLHRQNKTLEGIAEALWRKMFVEEARESWAEVSLLEIIDILGGGTPSTEAAEYWDGSIPWISAKDITANHSGFIMETGKRITEAGLQNSATKILPKYATVISARGTVGSYCIISSPMAFSQTNYGILPRMEDCFLFTYLLIGHVVAELKAAAYGSVFDTITTSTFKEQKFRVPPKSYIKALEDTVRPSFDKILSNGMHIRTLSRLRDTLLPKLMSGEVRVKL